MAQQEEAVKTPHWALECMDELGERPRTIDLIHKRAEAEFALDLSLIHI